MTDQKPNYMGSEEQKKDLADLAKKQEDRVKPRRRRIYSNYSTNGKVRMRRSRYV